MILYSSTTFIAKNNHMEKLIHTLIYVFKIDLQVLYILTTLLRINKQGNLSGRRDNASMSLFDPLKLIPGERGTIGGKGYTHKES